MLSVRLSGSRSEGARDPLCQLRVGACWLGTEAFGMRPHVLCIVSGIGHLGKPETHLWLVRKTWTV